MNKNLSFVTNYKLSNNICVVNGDLHDYRVAQGLNHIHIHMASVMQKGTYGNTVFPLIRTPRRYAKRQGGVSISYRISNFADPDIPRIIPNSPGPYFSHIHCSERQLPSAIIDETNQQFPLCYTV